LLKKKPKKKKKKKKKKGKTTNKISRMTNSNKNKSGKKNYAMINLFTMLPVSNYV
jgi:hypothetical protein